MFGNSLLISYLVRFFMIFMSMVYFGVLWEILLSWEWVWWVYKFNEFCGRRKVDGGGTDGAIVGWESDVGPCRWRWACGGAAAVVAWSGSGVGGRRWGFVYLSNGLVLMGIHEIWLWMAETGNWEEITVFCLKKPCFFFLFCDSLVICVFLL